MTPAAGAGCLYTQQGTGTTPGYSALDARRAALSTLVEGVYGSLTAVTAGGVGGVTQADFLVTQRNAGANMSVDVNMPAGGFAWVQGDTINGQALYMVPVAGSNINEVIAGSDPTNPRIDQVILEIQDNVLDASAGNLARTRVLTGTPTVGATLVNRTGAVALPGSALLLADILVPASSSTVPTSNTKDRRVWARGFDSGLIAFTYQGTAAAFGGSSPGSRLISGRVWLFGQVFIGNSDTITITATHRPARQTTFAVADASTGGVAGSPGLIIPTSGVVPHASIANLSLEGISYTLT